LAPIAALAVLVGGAGSISLAAQGQGPLRPPKGPEVVRIPTNPAPDKPPIPPEEIIRRFSAQEDESARALSNYTYHKTVRLEELGGNGRPTGQAQVVTEIVVADDGSRRPRPLGRSDSTLRVLALEPDALEMLARMATFPFGAAQVPKYDFAYQTSEPVDELMTYVFRVTPKQLDRTHAYFSGLIWVDDHDLAIVRSYGKWISETGDFTLPNLPFSTFETYRQPVSNKYWMPAYLRSDGAVSQKEGDVSVRLVVLWDHYTPIRGGKPSQAPAATEPPTQSTP
jgi:hypothetical protein